MTEKELLDRYYAAAHAMQSATALMLESGRDNSANPKHLRVGLNSSLVNSSALGELLIDRGVITKLEYLEAITKGMEKEAEARAVDARKMLNLPNLTFG